MTYTTIYPCTLKKSAKTKRSLQIPAFIALLCLNGAIPGTASAVTTVSTAGIPYFPAFPLIPTAYQGSSDLINFNFGKNYEGTAVAGYDGLQYWNSLYSSKKNPVTSLDTIHASDDSVVANASISWSNDGYTINSNDTAFNSTQYKELMSYYDVSGSSANISIAGLNPGTYDLYVYSQVDKKSTWQTLSITVDGQTLTTSDPGTMPSTFIEGVNYLKMSVASDASGAINIEYAPGVGSDYGAVNGFQLLRTGDLAMTGGPVNPVPEPSSLALIGSGLLALAMRFRKRLS